MLMENINIDNNDNDNNNNLPRDATRHEAGLEVEEGGGERNEWEWDRRRDGCLR